MNESDISRVIEMAWEDRTPFDAIEAQFGLNEQAVKELMRGNLKRSSYQLWRKSRSELMFVMIVRLMASNRETSFSKMFGASACNSFTPKLI